MIQAVIVLILIIAILTAWVTVKVQGQTLSAAWVAPLYGGLACLLVAAVGGVTYWAGRADYERCVTSAERSQGGHDQSEQLYDTIDEVVGTDDYTRTAVLQGRPSLRVALDLNLPVLDPNDCEKP